MATHSVVSLTTVVERVDLSAWPCHQLLRQCQGLSQGELSWGRSAGGVHILGTWCHYPAGCQPILPPGSQPYFFQERRHICMSWKGQKNRSVIWDVHHSQGQEATLEAFAMDELKRRSRSQLLHHTPGHQCRYLLLSRQGVGLCPLARPARTVFQKGSWLPHSFGRQGC